MPKFDLPDWAGKTVLIAASGPSLVKHDIDYAKEKAIVVAINDVYTIAPYADVLFASDTRWWEHHRYVRGFRGQRWTNNSNGSTWRHRAESAGLHVVESANGNGLCLEPGKIHLGGNSGFQALNFAVACGSKRIVLTGFDCASWNGKTHFFGSHPAGLERNSPYAYFRSFFNAAATQLADMDISVINCTRLTSLQCFKKGLLRDVL